MCTMIFITAGEDYTAISQQFTFGSNASSHAAPPCVTVDAAPDSVSEDDEMFTLTIHTTDQNLDLIPNTTIVSIKDNIGKP